MSKLFWAHRGILTNTCYLIFIQASSLYFYLYLDLMKIKLFQPSLFDLGLTIIDDPAHLTTFSGFRLHFTPHVYLVMSPVTEECQTESVKTYHLSRSVSLAETEKVSPIVPQTV